MTMSDANLTAALKQAKSTKMFFAFVPKGSEGKLLVSKTKISPKQISDAKKEIGGGTPVTGTCFGDGSTMVFQVAKAAGTLANAIKNVAKRDAGLTKVRLATDADSEEEDTGVAPGEAVSAEAEPEDDADDDVQDIEQQAEAAEEEADAAELHAKAAADKAQIMERLTALVGPYKEAVANDGPNTRRLQALLATVKASIANQQFAQAGEGLDLLENLLAENPTPSPDVAEQDADEHDEDPKLEGRDDDGAKPEDESGKHDDDTAGVDGDGQDPADLDYGDWKAARQSSINVAKALAVKVAGTGHHLAKGVLAEINSIVGFIKKLPDNPSPEHIEKIVISINRHEAIADAEGAPAHIAGKVDIKSPLLKALEGLKG
jgi:hypothetical protein